MSNSINTSILEVNGHRVPVIAYKRIVQLWRRGWSEAEITQEASNAMRNHNIATISEVVLGAINDQKFAFTFSGEVGCENYLDLPLHSPQAIAKAQLALQETRTALARAETIENEYAVKAMRLMESRPTYVGQAKTHSDRMERQAYMDQMTQNALKKRQRAEEDIVHLKEVKKIRQRLLALSMCSG